MYDFQLYDIDPDFGYLSETLPDSCICTFGDQLSRAREILKGRSAEELAYAFESLDWMLRKGGEHHFYRALQEVEARGMSFTNRTKALKYLQENFDITDQTQFPKARWADYFAAFALAVIGEQLLSDKRPPTDPALFPSEEEARAYDKQIQRSLEMERALESMEAVCIAEVLQNGPSEPTEAVETVSQTMRAQGQRGGKVRAARYGELKAKVISLSEQHHSNRSNRNSARRIYEAIAGEVDAVLTTDDPPKTLEKWIGDYRRQQRQAQKA